MLDIIRQTPSDADAEHDAAHHRAPRRSALGSLQTFDRIVDSLDNLRTLGVVARDDGMQVHVRRRAEHLRRESPLPCALRLILVMRQHALALVRARLLEDLLDALAPLHQLGHAQLVPGLVAVLPRSQCCDLRERKHDVVLAAHDGHHRELLTLRGRHRHAVDPRLRVGGIVQLAHDVQHDGRADERRRCEDVEPDRSLDDEPKRLRTRQQHLAGPAPRTQKRQGEVARSVEERLPLAFPASEEEVRHHTQPGKGLILIQR